MKKKKTLELKELIENIREKGHNGFMNARNNNSSDGARKAMEKRIDYYKMLIEENKIKIVSH